MKTTFAVWVNVGMSGMAANELVLLSGVEFGIRPLGSKLFKCLLVFLLLIAVTSATLAAILMLAVRAVIIKNFKIRI